MTLEEKEELRKRCKEMTGHDAIILDKEDTFSFDCVRCGQCCRGYREDIILNPYDIYDLSVALKIPGEAVIQQYCTSWIGRNSRVPILALSHDKSNGWCHFLEFNPKDGLYGCSVNDHKPGACMLHPVGVIREEKKNTNEKSMSFMLTEMCDHHKEKPQVIEDWLKGYLNATAERDAGAALSIYPRDYFDASFLADIIEQNNSVLDLPEDHPARTVTEKTRFMLRQFYASATLSTLYSFNFTIPFLDQMEIRKKEFNEIIDKIIDLCHSCGIDIAKKEEN